MEQELKKLRWTLVGIAFALALVWFFGPGRYEFEARGGYDVYRLDTSTGDVKIIKARE